MATVKFSFKTDEHAINIFSESSTSLLSGRLGFVSLVVQACLNLHLFFASRTLYTHKLFWVGVTRFFWSTAESEVLPQKYTRKQMTAAKWLEYSFRKSVFVLFNSCMFCITMFLFKTSEKLSFKEKIKTHDFCPFRWACKCTWQKW